MDDNNSPPSSKKSAISKIDLVETPRMSPYRTRSRKNSNLTEENIAMHNESPSTVASTRRVTRRMSQGSENATIAVTPMPQAAKRSRRSPSVASDDLVQTPKKKFHVAQENVVMEEDEEENKADGKSQSASVTENGSEVVNSNATTNEVDGSMSVVNKVPVLKDSNQIDTPVDQAGDVENEKSLKATQQLKTNFPDKENVTSATTLDSTMNNLDSGTTNVTAEISTINSALAETTEGKDSEPLGKSATSTIVHSLQSIGKSKSDSVSSPLSSISSESIKAKRTLRSTRSSIVSSSLEKGVSDSISSVSNSSDPKDLAQTTDTVSSSPKDLAEANFSLWLGDTTNAKSEKLNSNVPVTPTRAPPDSLTKSTVFKDSIEVTTIPDTPVRPIPVTSSTASPHTPAKTVPLVEQHPVAVSTTNQATTLKTTPAAKKDSNILPGTPSKTVETTQVTSLVKSTVLQDDMDITAMETPKKSTLGTPSKTLAQTLSKTVVVQIPSKTVPLTTQITSLIQPTVLQDDMDITVMETPKKSTLGTPGKTFAQTPSKAVSLTTQVTSLVKSTVPQDDMDITVLETPKKPTLETPGKTMDITVLETPKKPTLETPGKTLAQTPSKTVSVVQTPSKTVSLTTQVTSLVNSTILQDDMDITVLKTSKKPTLETTGKTLAQTPSKTVSVAQEAMDVSTSNQGTPLKTTPIMHEDIATNTPKIVSVTNQESSSKGASPNTEQSIENGTEDEDMEYPKWGSSVRRKSDGKPIDSFGIKKDIVATTTLTVKRSSKNVSIISINDSSEDDDPRNDFIDDEAEETNGEDSMDEEERKYIEENEVPDDGISIGSDDTDGEEVSDEKDSDDSFIVSDSSNQLLEGIGDDLEIETSEPKTKRRSNKILDTSDEELPVDVKTRKSLSKKSSQSKIDESSDENMAEELANLDAEPKKKVNSKRLSDKMSLSKKDVKRQSLHPNTKLNDLKDDQNKSMFSENGPSESSEDDVAAELANLDSEPKKVIRSKRLSDTVLSSKKDAKRMSLHHNAKLNSGKMKDDENKSMFSEDDESRKNDVEEELANLNAEPSKAISSKRLSDSVSRSKKDMIEDLANLDAEPKKNTSSKRLSEKMSPPKKDNKRLSLHPNAKLNCDGFESYEKPPESMINESDEHIMASIVPNDNTNTIENMDVVECNGQTDSTPSTSQQQVKAINFEEIQARCNDYLSAASEAKREQKSKPKAIEEEKLQKLKEKKAMKLQEKKDKEARMLQQEALAAKQRQLKKEKKSKLAKVTDEEKEKAIEKALAFSETIKSMNNPHSTEMKQESSTETGDSTSAGTTPKNKGRKRKLLQILEEVPKKKVRFDQEQQIPAKPEGFMIHSRPIPNKKLRKDKRIQRKIAPTSAGNFVVEPMAKKPPSPFTVTTLKYSAPPSFKNKVVFNSNVPRESAAQLLARQKKQKQLQKY